jgi:hypothetical protein
VRRFYNRHWHLRCRTLLLILLSAGSAQAAEVAGTVTDTAGTALPGARVFAEPGVGGALLETTASDTGAFIFVNLPPGPVGVFAIAPGKAFGGAHQNLTIGEMRTGLTIRLRPAASVEARIVSAEGDTVSGALVTRIGILGEEKVGIPLNKLREKGFSLPESDESGSLTIPNLPEGLKIALKVGHPLYAQEGVDGVPVPTSDQRITLHRGVLLQGDVVSRGEQLPVAGATVVIRNAQPPHDTAITESNSQGLFSLRLKPGVYLYRAAGAGSSTAGWQQLRVTGEASQRKAHLVIGGTGVITGEVRDAVSGNPIQDARLSLETNGNAAAIVRTGPTGQYRFEATEGQNIVRLEAAPGYQRSQEDGVKLMVTAGSRHDLPGLWLAPLKPYTLRVVGSDGVPVPGALVNILRPFQFGGIRTTRQGEAQIAVGNLPTDGKVIGTVNYIDGNGKRWGALFSLDRTASNGALVQVLPLATVRGIVKNEEDDPLEGIVVGGVFPGREESEEPLLLWRCVSGPDGTFEYRAIVPRVPQQCLARDVAGKTGQGMRFNAEDGATVNVGTVVVPGGTSGTSMLGKKIDRDAYAVSCPSSRPTVSPMLWVFTPQDQAAPTLDGLTRLRQQGLDFSAEVIVDGAFDCGATQFPVRSGANPGTATSLLLDDTGVVLHETVGLPNLFELKK